MWSKIRTVYLLCAAVCIFKSDMTKTYDCCVLTMHVLKTSSVLRLVTIILNLDVNFEGGYSETDPLLIPPLYLVMFPSILRHQ